MRTQTRSCRARTAVLGIAVLATLTMLMPTLAGCTSTSADSQPQAESAAGSIDINAPAPTPSSEPDAPTESPDLPVEKANITDPVEFDSGVTVRIESVTATTVDAETPGEVSGSAVVVTVSAQNSSASPINVDSAIVNLVAEDGEYGIGTTAGPDAPLSGSVAPGESVEGVYVFMLGSAKDRTVEVTVNYAAGAPVAEFTGKTS